VLAVHHPADHAQLECFRLAGADCDQLAVLQSLGAAMAAQVEAVQRLVEDFPLRADVAAKLGGLPDLRRVVCADRRYALSQRQHAEVVVQSLRTVRDAGLDERLAGNVEADGRPVADDLGRAAVQSSCEAPLGYATYPWTVQRQQQADGFLHADRAAESERAGALLLADSGSGFAEAFG